MFEGVRQLIKNYNVRLKFIFIFLILFLGVAVCVQTGASYNFDWFVYENLCKIRNVFLNKFMLFITNFGDMVAVIGVAVVSLLISYVFKYKNYCLEILSISAFQHICNRVLKSIFQRPRIREYILVHESSYSFPSGHTMTAVVLWGFIIYIMSKGKYKKYCFFPLIIILLVGFSRIYLGAHYFTDVLGAGLIGLVILILEIMFIEAVKKD